MTQAPATAADTTVPEQASGTTSPAASDGAAENPRLRIIEAQQSELEELRRQLQQRAAELAQVQQTAAAAQQAAERAAQEAGGLRQGLEAAGATLRRLLLAAAPEVPEELVQGATPEEVEHSYRRARAMVERIKAQLQAQALRQAQGGRLPAGAPPRRAPDLASLTPQEKIALALQRGAGQPS